MIRPRFAGLLLCLLSLLVAVLMQKALIGWFWFFVTIAGDPARGTTELLNLGAEGRTPLLFMLRLDRWKDQAVSSLGQISDDPVVIAALVKVVREDARLRSTALQSLGYKAAPGSLGILAEYGEVRPLTRMGEPGKLALLDIQANFPKPAKPYETDRRVWALEAVCEAFSGDADVRQRVGRELQSSEVELRVAAVKCQRRVLDPGAALGILRDVLGGDVSEVVRATAAGELGKLGDTNGMGQAVMFLRADDPKAICAAASALGEIGDDSAVPALATAWRDRGSGCAQSALWRFLRLWSGSPGPELEVAIDTYWKGKEEIAARRALGARPPG